MKLVSTSLKPVVWLFAMLSLMLLNAADWALRPLIAVLIEPNSDISNSPCVAPMVEGPVFRRPMPRGYGGLAG